ncbi:MAG: anaerobic ribonucleoside-triphosphate reductase activating protein [Candidatus Omnitrophota bacterium]|nr:anaerobic ribonucleoside-triphosphate reductase activating protein [Candidatus Omnitrophota bacterium]MDZ4243014.1 anaerobic ribonucleoside-triphosphate reductase activating protein [Candidatus Omnitrophota bacterium]
MKIGGLQKFSLIDFPGRISAVIFTQGCNFRCPFCHNPELVLPELFREPIPEQEVMDFLKRRKEYLEGVTVTGGEPTLQKDLPDFLEKVRALGYAIKLDTNGSNPAMLGQILARNLVNYVAMDIKAPLAKYDRVAGVSGHTEAVQCSIDLILASRIPHQFRTTVVKALCSEQDIEDAVPLVKNSRHYILQKFIPSEKILSRDLVTHPQYSDEDMAVLKERWERHSHSVYA